MPIDLPEIRALIARHKRYDALFGVLGLVALMIGVLTFVALFTDMAWNGMGRLDWGFFTNYPSRRPAQAGILSAWVRPTPGVVTTPVIPVSLRGAPRLSLQEDAPQHSLT